MQKILDAISEHAAHLGDDLDLGWEVIVNGLVVRVAAGTRAEYATTGEAWAAALALRGELVDAVGQQPLTHEEMRVVARPGGPHDMSHPLTGYRGWIRFVWPVTVLGRVRAVDGAEPHQIAARLIL